MTELPLVILSGGLMAAAVWLLLSGHLLRILFGILLMSQAINLAVFLAGGLTPGVPPLLSGPDAGPAVMANALPQALLLTAIVIGFGLFAFALALVLRATRLFGHAAADRIRLAEPEDKP